MPEVKLVDLAKKNKKAEYERLASERLKDLLQLPIDDNLRYDVLNALISRAQAKKQDAYVQELVTQVIKLSPIDDPALVDRLAVGAALRLRRGSGRRP